MPPFDLAKGKSCLVMTTLHNAALFDFSPLFIKILLKTYVKSCVFDRAGADESDENLVAFCCESNSNHISFGW